MTFSQASKDYRRIEEAIAYLRKHRAQQPSLAELAVHSGLSEAHFQRLFSRWAGISPKRFLQFLNIEFAKQRMSETHDLLNLALDTGLSGSGRLHDLFVTLEALSPGEYKERANGLEITYGRAPTPFGEALLAFSKRGVCHLSFVDQAQDDGNRLAALWPQARLTRCQAKARALAERIFSAARHDSPIAAWVVGSNFQVQVWRALLAVGPGRLLSYAQLAEQVGRPRAARAVGTAMAVNPIGYLIPCHRVLRGSGDIGIYHWGSTRKLAMLGYEAARS